jgi:molecular chaperone GrpE (heat shock protein)
MTEEHETRIVLERIEALMAEVRRQGRASIAAQAAAESCLESVQSLQGQLDAPSLRDEPHDEPTDDDDSEDMIRALFPFIDALERTTDQARALADTAPKPSAIARWLGVPDMSPALRSLREGTRLLRAQLEDVLVQWDVRVDRTVGVPVDPTVHRVVDTRPVADNEQADIVLEVIRPAILLGDRLLREADVLASTK